MSRQAPPACAPEAFEQKYRSDPDPWDFASSGYERQRYEITLAALTRDRYACAFEPGCSIGELTARLASRCDRLLALDVSQTAVDLARRRCASLENVRIECGDLRTTVLDTPVDLIVLSEVAYYFDDRQLEALGQRLAAGLAAGGTLLAAHWLGHSADHVLHGDEVHTTLLRSLPLQHVKAERHAGFRLDLWMRT